MNFNSVLSCLSLLLAAAASQDPKPCGEYGHPMTTAKYYFLCWCIACEASLYLLAKTLGKYNCSLYPSYYYIKFHNQLYRQISNYRPTIK